MYPRAWLVLAFLPLVASATPPALLEAEAATLGGGTERLAFPTASGGAAVHVPDQGGPLRWTITAPRAGRYEFAIRYRTARDVAGRLRLDDQEWGVGFVTTGEFWGESRRVFSLTAGPHTVALASDYGEILVDSITLSHDDAGRPAPVYELPALTPRRALAYAATPRALGFKLELNGHQLVRTALDGREVATTNAPFEAIPDTVRVQFPAAALAQLEPGDHRLECQMEDGSVASAVVRVARAARAAPFAILSLDVGHGKATLLCLPNGEVALVDTGTAEAAERTIVPLLHRQGIQRIDHLIVTHPHDDHDGGAALIRREFAIGRELDYRSVHTGDHLQLGGVDVLVLNAYDAGDDENSRSLALRWQYGQFVYSDGADNYALNQRRCLAQFPDQIRADVYYTNHHLHGSVDVDFLRKVDAALYLVSAQEAVYARGAYSQQFKGLVEPHLRAAGARFQESLLSYDVGHVLIRVQADGTWTYECHSTADPDPIPALR